MGPVFEKFIAQNAAVIAQNQQLTGAYAASPNFAAYRYTWFRDGSFTADAMSRAGEIDSSEQFFAWGAKVITDRRDLILEGGRLDTRYTYEGQEVPGEWANYQLDGFGVFLWALKNHSDRHNRTIDAYQDAIQLLKHYLSLHWQEPCFDWWEEREAIHASTLACIYAGLHAFDYPDAEKVKAAITLDTERIDGSLIACGLFGAVDHETFAPILTQIEHELIGRDSGVHRYKADSYFGGGQWPVLSALLGLYYLKLGRVADAKKQLLWCIHQTDINRWLPEQTHVDLNHPDEYAAWVARVGEPANPLLWSHAMVISLTAELLTTA